MATKKINQDIEGDYNFQQAIEQQHNYFLGNEISEEKVREISASVAKEICGEYFLVSQETVNSRINVFENMFIKRFDELNHKFEPLKDPSFTYCFRQAEIQAAMTDDESSYKMLIELLARREAKKSDKNSLTGIQGAIQIVNEISDQSLTALTVLLCVVSGIRAVEPAIDNGLAVLNDMYRTVLTADLPTDNDWQDQLDILKAVRLSTVGPFIKFDQILFNQYTNSSYLSIGIKKSSDNYNRAEKILESIGDIHLMMNPYFSDYYVLPFTSGNSNDIVKNYFAELDDDARNEIASKLNSIYSLYEKDSSKQEIIKQKFIEKWDSFDKLKKIHVWWDSIKYSCEITSIGRVLGNAYAKRCYKGFPSLD